MIDFWWRRVPTPVIFALYRALEPTMHDPARVGWCRYPNLCAHHTVRLSRRELGGHRRRGGRL